MAVLNCLPQKLSKLAVGIIFILFGLCAVVLGFTVLPVFGFVLAVPFFWLAWYFIRVHLNRQCEIES
jgi:hypothetical protein